MKNNADYTHGYSEVNGISMYYEIYGQGKPLVLIHGGGSTIQTTFGRVIPELAKKHRLIGVEMQAHGRTGDRDTPLSFEQDADDIAALLGNLGIKQSDILGFSNGGQTAIELAIRHPLLIDKLIIAGVFYKRSAVDDQFWKGLNNATFDHLPQAFKDAFLEVNHNTDALHKMFDRDVQRMRTFKGWSDEQMKSIKAQTLVIGGDSDVGSVEHLAEMYRVIPDCRLAIIPGGHGKLLGEIITLDHGRWTQEYVVSLLEEFLA